MAKIEKYQQSFNSTSKIYTYLQFNQTKCKLEIHRKKSPQLKNLYLQIAYHRNI